MPFMNSFWISRSGASNRGQYAGLYTVAWATAQVLGPVIGSQVAQQFGFTTLWWVMGSFCFFTACGFFSMAVGRKFFVQKTTQFLKRSEA